jgi:hypothetical protein
MTHRITVKISPEKEPEPVFTCCEHVVTDRNSSTALLIRIVRLGPYDGRAHEHGDAVSGQPKRSPAWCIPATVARASTSLR